VRPRTIVLIVALSGAAGGAVPLLSLARSGEIPWSLLILAGAATALLAVSIVAATIGNVRLMLRLAAIISCGVLGSAAVLSIARLALGLR